MSEQLTKLLGELSGLAEDLAVEAKDARTLGMDSSVQRELRDKLLAMVRRHRREAG